MCTDDIVLLTPVSSVFAFTDSNLACYTLFTTVAEQANLNDPVNPAPEPEKDQRHSNDRQRKFWYSGARYICRLICTFSLHVSYILK